MKNNQFNKTTMITIGVRLQQKREESGLTIEQVSDEVKIRPRYLEALEQGNYDVFPSSVYIKGFLRNYAKFLNIDSDKAVALYRREFEGRKEDGLAQANGPIKEPKFIISPTHVVAGVFGIMLVILFGYLYRQYQQFAAPPFLEIISPRDGFETKEDIVTIEGLTESGSAVKINDQGIQTDALGNFKVTVSLREGSNQIKIASENGIGKKSENYLNVFLKPDLVAASNETVNEESSGAVAGEDEEIVYNGLELEIKIGPNSAWLLVETDDEVGFTGVLVPDTIKTFKGNEKIYLKTGNAGSTTVKLNGIQQESLGAEGDVESREYTKNMLNNQGTETLP